LIAGRSYSLLEASLCCLNRVAAAAPACAVGGGLSGAKTRLDPQPTHQVNLTYIA